MYTVKRVVPSAREAVTQKPGLGLLLEELPNPGDPVCFAAWRFVPLEDEFMRLVAAEGASSAGVVVGQAFQPAGVGDFPVARSNTGLESPVNRRTGMSALPAGCQAMKPNSPPCTDAESRRYFEERYRIEAGDVNVGCAARLRAVATATEPLTFDYGHTLQPGQLLAELALMRSVPVHWPSLPVADALRACGLLGGVEENHFLHLERRARFTGSWQRRLQRFSANVLAHADAAGLSDGRGQASRPS